MGYSFATLDHQTRELQKLLQKFTIHLHENKVLFKGSFYSIKAHPNNVCITLNVAWISFHPLSLSNLAIICNFKECWSPHQKRRVSDQSHKPQVLDAKKDYLLEFFCIWKRSTFQSSFSENGSEPSMARSWLFLSYIWQRMLIRQQQQRRWGWWDPI